MKICLTIFATLVTVCPLYGTILYPNAPQYTAGAGSNEATIVIDFDAGNYFTFKYKWDGAATGWDALAAVDSAGALDVLSKWYPEFSSHFVNDFIFPGGNKFNYGQDAFTGWGYFGSVNGENWVINSGVDTRPLANGSWDAWVWSNYDFNVSWDPIRGPGQSPIPEPATVSLLFLGVGLLINKNKITKFK